MGDSGQGPLSGVWCHRFGVPDSRVRYLLMHRVCKFIDILYVNTVGIISQIAKSPGLKQQDGIGLFLNWSVATSK